MFRLWIQKIIKPFTILESTTWKSEIPQVKSLCLHQIESTYADKYYQVICHILTMATMIAFVVEDENDLEVSWELRGLNGRGSF